tara:strand:+ start:67 stop:231 length:165 start_codon:yes stop_codon:yes gene_type:complete
MKTYTDQVIRNLSIAIVDLEMLLDEEVEHTKENLENTIERLNEAKNIVIKLINK